MNLTTLPTREDTSKFVIYNLDHTTPRVVFEVINGCAMITENTTPSPHAIPGEHRSFPCLHHRQFNIHTLIVDGELEVSTRLDEEQEMMVYGRALVAGMRTIDELVNFLKEQLRTPRLEVVLPDF